MFQKFFFISEDSHQIAATEITTNSISNSDSGEFDPQHAIDGNFNGLYHADRFDPSSTYDQTFTIKVDFGKAYLIRCFKYKTENEQEFALRIGASKQNDVWFAGSGYTSASN